jgi:hypothetical protein
MSAVGSEAVTPGALYELVARGNKDKYFFSDDLDAESTVNPFSTTYESTDTHLDETKTFDSRNAVDWGRTVEFELEQYGDVLAEAYIRIQMPSWFPSLPLVAGGQTYEPQIANWQQHIVSATGAISYGWTRGIAYFLFERIQILQDAVLIQDISGDSLQALATTMNSNNQYYLDAAQTGMHDGAARAIAAAATPGLLRLRLPWPGCQGLEDGGFPLCCLKGQGFKVRLTLRRPEAVWESDKATTVAPWDQTFLLPTTGITVSGCGRAALPPPTLLLETTQRYLSEEKVRSLVDRHLFIPFIQYYDETFTISGADYLPLDRGGTSVIQRRMEGRHPMERLLFIFRLQQWLESGQRWRVAVDDRQQFYNTLSLQIAGQDREFAWPAPVWQDCECLAKDDRSANKHLSEMRWNIRPPADRAWYESRQPTGAVNFTTASRPTLAIDLRDVPANPRTGERMTELQICGESWGVYEIVAGRGRMLFLD